MVDRPFVARPARQPGARPSAKPAAPFTVLATDYDGTIATAGRVDEPTLAALARLRETGWSLVLVTGRQLDDLEHVFPRLDAFDRVVAENGGLLYRPARREVVALAPPPSPPLVAMLRKAGVQPLGVGRVIVATSEPHERTLADAIDSLGLDYHLVLNKGAVMALPRGVDKASGLEAAVAELAHSLAHVVAVGDAENDVAFLRASGFSVAVGNALPSLTSQVDFVTAAPGPAGVRELVERLVAGALPAPWRPARA